jgi:hypothetical protein
MRPRLKEDPKEWRKFALLCGVMLLVVSGVLYWRKVVSIEVFYSAGAAVVGMAILVFVYPKAFRPIYRGAMTVSFAIGQVMGKVVLGAFYILVLTPLGLVLRVMGKDLLETRLERERPSYWKEARKRGKMDQQF